MNQYLNLMQTIIDFGVDKIDRTGTGTKSIFAHQMRFDLNLGFPLVTTKKVHIKSIIHELLWFIKGDTNIQYLRDHNVRIWDEWADENGDLGPVYGAQWRAWQNKDGSTTDQLAELIHQIKNTPDSRRLIISAWNVGEINKMALPPCHLLCQFYVADNRLSCQLYQRSADVFLGVPFNIASYALLTHMIAHVCNLDVGDFIWTGGDCHLYNNHQDQTLLQLTRTPFTLPKLVIKRQVMDINEFEFDDFDIQNYQHHAVIKGKVSV